MLIFTLLQMQLFGGQYQTAVDAGAIEEIPRYNYDDLWTAFVSTFQTVTGENWNSQLADGNAAFGPIVIIVLIALALVGNFLFFNLFLAILLGAFESESQAEEMEKKAAEEEAAGAGGVQADALHGSSADAGDDAGPPSGSLDYLLQSQQSDSIAPNDSIAGTGAKPSQLIGVTAFTTALLPSSGADTITSPTAVLSSPTGINDTTASAHVHPGGVDDPDISVAAPVPLRHLDSRVALLARAAPASEIDPQLSPRTPSSSSASSAASQRHGAVESPSSLSASGTSAFLPPIHLSRAHKGSESVGVEPSIAVAARQGPVGSFRPGSAAALAAATRSTAADVTSVDQPRPTPPPSLQLQANRSVEGGGRGVSRPGSAMPQASASTTPRARAGTSGRSPSPPAPSPLSFEKQQSAMDLQMTVKDGATRVIETKVRGGDGREVAVRVLASGDVQLMSNPELVGSHWDPNHAFKRLGVYPDVDTNADGEALPPVTDTPAETGSLPAGLQQQQEQRDRKRHLRMPAPPRSLGCLSVNNKLRQAAAILVAHPWFERLILLLILVSSIKLALDEPRIEECRDIPYDGDGSCMALYQWLKYSDIIITGLFVLEMTAKIIALGFVNHKGSYLRNTWNGLDFTIVIISVLSLALADLASKLKALRSLRALRALRPLRVVSRYPGLKLVVNAVIGALPKAFTVLVVNFLFLLLLAIVGLQNFAGALSSCNDPSIVLRADCIGTWTLTGDACNLLPHDTLVDACVQNADGYAGFPRIWAPTWRNFDDIFHSLCTVFEVATGEAWPDIMYPVLDSVGPGLPMDKGADPAAALYFIIIQVCCGFFLLELFTGVIIANYYALKERSQGSGLLTEQQKAWVEQMKIMLSARAQKYMTRPDDANETIRYIRNRLFRIVTSSPFEWLIMGVILCNTAVLAMRHYGEEKGWVDGQEVANNIFAIIFIIEAAMKLSAFGIKQYFAVPWNRFDFALVIASVIGWAVAIGAVTTLLRVFRVARIIRLVRTSRGLLMLFRTLIISIPSLANVGIILLLMLFIFAIISMNLFAGVRYDGEFLNHDANFDSFFTALLTLFRSSTGENFNGVMHALEVQPPYCIKEGDDTFSNTGFDLRPNCGDTYAPAIFFSLFFTLSSFVLIKLLVAVVLDSFSDMLAAEESDSNGIFTLTPDVLDQYQECWSVCDPEATRFVREGGLIRLVTMLNHPLGVPGAPGVGGGNISLRKAAVNLLYELDLPPSTEGRYQFHAILQELTKRAQLVTNPNIGAAKVAAAARVHVSGDSREAQHSLRETLAAMRIQSVFRASRARRRFKAMVEMRRKQMSESSELPGQRRRKAKGGLPQRLWSRARRLWNDRSLAAVQPLQGGGVHAVPVATTSSGHAYQWGQRDKERIEKDKALYGTG